MPSRKLAAILFSDIVGYTKLMGFDEKRALEVLEFNRALHQEMTRKYGGKYIKEMGDGTLLSFPSASAAVECAMEIASRKQGQRYELKMGIHMGDVVFDNDDVFGDGVNIASRIEGVAIPGSILISQQIYDEVHNKMHVHATHVGEFHLKNDRQSRSVYALDMPGLAVPDKVPGKIKTQLQGSFLSGFRLVAIVLLLALIAAWIISNRDAEEFEVSTERVVLVVFPFKDSQSSDYPLSGKDVAAGLSEKLSTSRGFTTISPAAVNTTQILLSKASMLPRNNKKALLDSLGATHYLEGVIGSDISLELYQVGKGKPLLKKEIELTPINALIRELSDHISNTLHLAPVPLWTYNDRSERVAQNYIKALNHWQNRNDRNEFDEAIRVLRESLSIDSNDPHVHALLALCYANGLQRRLYSGSATQTEEKKREIELHASRALEISHDEPYALLAIGTLHFVNNNFGQSHENYLAAFKIAPEKGITAQALGELSLYTGSPSDALIKMKTASMADPKDPIIMQYMAWCEMANGFASASYEICEQMVKTFDHEKHRNYFRWADHLLNDDFGLALDAIPDSVGVPMSTLLSGIILIEAQDSVGFEEFIFALAAPNEKYVQPYLEMLWKMTRNSPGLRDEGRDLFYTLFKKGDFTLNWMIQTYPFQCFNIIRTDSEIISHAAKYGITYSVHPYFKIQSEIRE